MLDLDAEEFKHTCAYMYTHLHTACTSNMHIIYIYIWIDRIDIDIEIDQNTVLCLAQKAAFQITRPLRESRTGAPPMSALLSQQPEGNSYFISHFKRLKHGMFL